MTAGHLATEISMRLRAAVTTATVRMKKADC